MIQWFHTLLVVIIIITCGIYPVISPPRSPLTGGRYRLRASSIRPDKMMKVLVALLLATSVEGLNTKKQVALKKPLLLRGGALDAKTALLTQTAGLAAFGSEFILSKWASTRYWVRARRYTRKPHTLRA